MNRQHPVAASRQSAAFVRAEKGGALTRRRYRGMICRLARVSNPAGIDHFQRHAIRFCLAMKIEAAFNRRMRAIREAPQGAVWPNRGEVRPHQDREYESLVARQPFVS